MSSPDELRTIIGNINDPELGKSFNQLNMLKDVSVDGSNVKVAIELPTPAYPEQERISQLVNICDQADRRKPKRACRFDLGR